MTCCPLCALRSGVRFRFVDANGRASPEVYDAIGAPDLRPITYPLPANRDTMIRWVRVPFAADPIKARALASVTLV